MKLLIALFTNYDYYLFAQGYPRTTFLDGHSQLEAPHVVVYLLFFMTLHFSLEWWRWTWLARTDYGKKHWI